MIKFNKIIITIASACFSISLAIFLIVEKLIFGNNSSIANILLLAFSTIGVYSMIFSSLIWIYKKYIHKRINNIYNLDGDWFVISEIQGSEKSITSIRHGKCSIDANLSEGIKLTGEHLRIDNTFSSSWSSETADILGGRLVLFYISDGISSHHPISRGVITLNINGSPPTLMNGVWSDIAPLTNRGITSFFRDEAKYLERLDVLKNVYSNETTI